MIEYKATPIAPKGRNKYGNYVSSTNITKSVIRTTYAGNDTTTTIGTGGSQEDTGTTNFYAMLSLTNITFSGLDLVDGADASTLVIAYQGYGKAPTLVYDLNAVSAVTTSDGFIEELISPPDSGITGIPNGMTVIVADNGTSAATINIHAENIIPDKGTMNIPVCVYKRTDNVPSDANGNQTGDLMNWYEHAYLMNEDKEWEWNNSCEIVWLELAWSVNRAATSNYQMDLSNEKAGVNVSATTAQGDVLYPNSIASLTCTASTHMNGAIVSGITYSISQMSLTRFNARGVNIVNEDNLGKLVFTSAGTNQFNFNGPTLPLDIIATPVGETEPIATKTMTIEKNYPGSDGQAAVTRWIVTSHDVVHYNPNTSGITPEVLSAWVMTQIGGEEPVIDPTSATTILYGYDTPTPTQPLTKNTDGIVSARTYYNTSSTTFALKNSSGVYYEVEEVPTIWDGYNGTDGASGKNGTDGVDGKSAWYLTLDNDNASINADADGNIYQYAIRPVCHGKLYYGSSLQKSADFLVDYGEASGVTTGVSTGGVLTINFGNNFNFSDDVLSIAVSGLSSGQVQDVKYMNVTKSRAGEDGESGKNGTDAVSYWLDVSYGEVIFTRSDSSYTPSSITCTAWMQRGEEAMVHPTDTTIKYQWQSRLDGDWTTTSTYSSSISIDAKKCVDYCRLRFTLMKGSTQLDQEDVDILMNGLDGKNGQGRAGAAIRGPYDYYAVSSSTQCWCGGDEGTVACDDCSKWIDIVYKDGTYYRCIKSFTGRCATNAASGINNTTYWETGENYSFIASNLIMAENAKIKFLSGNELYLMSGNSVTAGAAGGNINFWAGWGSPSENAPFRVYNDGRMVATKGTFGCFSIGKDENNNNALVGNEVVDDGIEIQTFDSYINPRNLNFSGTYSGDGYTNQYSVRISPDENYQDNYGALVTANFDNVVSGRCGNISPEYVENIGFATNGNVVANRFKGNVKTPRISAGPNIGTAVMSLYPTDIVYMTSDPLVFTKEGHWFVGGTIDTGISTAEPKDLFFKTGSTWYYDGRQLTFDGVCISGGTTGSIVSGAVGNMLQWHFNGMPLNMWVASGDTSVPVPVTGQTNANKWKNGYWELPTGDLNGGHSDFQISGIAHPDYLTKRNNTIYIEV